MHTNRMLLFVTCLSVLVIGIGCGSYGAPTSNKQPVAKPATPSIQQALDVLSQRCMPCHKSGTPKEELALDSAEGLLKGSEHGPVFIAGDAAGSLIIQRMRATNGKKIMPPKGTLPTEEEIKAVEDWINAGAPSA